MRNRMYGGVRGRKTKVGEKLHRFPPTRLSQNILKINSSSFIHILVILLVFARGDVIHPVLVL